MQLKHTVPVSVLAIVCASCGGNDQSAGPTNSTSPPTATTSAGATRINDTDPSILYSRGNRTTQDWNYFQPAPEDYSQDEHASNLVRSGGAITGTGAVVNFSGTGITWIGKKGPGYGIASYSIDGGSPQTVDNYNSTAGNQKPIITVAGLAAESHVLSISLLDRKNAAATGYWQTLDAFAIDGSALTPAQGASAGHNSAELVFTGN
jgi:hypothetical protein